MDIIKSILIILAVLLYWKFIYYRYHRKDFTPISIFVVGAALFFYGIYAFFIRGLMPVQHIWVMYSIIFFFMVSSFILVIIGMERKGLNKNIDITLSWAKRLFPYVPYYIWLIIAFPVLFFIIVATYALLGNEYLVFWAMVLIAWIVSNIRLIRYIRK